VIFSDKIAIYHPSECGRTPHCIFSYSY